MKLSFKIAVLAALGATLIGCSSDDDSNSKNPLVNENKVDAYIQFENVFKGEKFTLGTDYDSDNNGVVTITALKYLISDVTFYGAEGTEDFSMSTEDSFHIVDQSCEKTLKKYFTNLPNGNYDRVSFLYGVSEELHEKGTEAQANMLVEAKKFGLDWGWTLGYRFLTYEGTYAGDTENTFKVHNGSHGSADASNTSRLVNSKKIVVDFSDKGTILVSDQTSPKVHLAIDIAKILSNKHNVKLEDYKGNIIVNPDSKLVSDNISEMFVIDHIHATDPNFDVPEADECKAVNPNDDGHGDHDHDKGDEHDDKKDKGDDDDDSDTD